jgi:SAM-dependent methyltransferase
MALSRLIEIPENRSSALRPLRAVRDLGRRLRQEFFPAPTPTHPFDLEHGVDTSGLLFAEHLASGHTHDDHINAYWGTPSSGFRGVMEHWRQTFAGTAYAIEDYSFIDIGCGKGRALMLASEMPFRRVIGVELNPDLTAIAGKNIAAWKTRPHPCVDIEVLNMDALDAPIPEGPAAVYIYNSFNLYVMLPFLDRLRQLAHHRAAPIDLIYAQPQQARLMESAPGLTLLAASSIPLSKEDKAACAFGTSTLDFRIYRIQPPPALQH